jgi:hypothetical protein
LPFEPSWVVYHDINGDHRWSPEKDETFYGQREVGGLLRAGEAQVEVGRTPRGRRRPFERAAARTGLAQAGTAQPQPPRLHTRSRVSGGVTGQLGPPTRQLASVVPGRSAWLRPVGQPITRGAGRS